MSGLPKNSAPPGHADAAPFVIGVTGHMSLPDGSEADLKAAVRDFYRWLVCPPRNPRSGHARPIPQRLEHIRRLGDPLELQDTPIVLLSSMAPGVDQLAAEVAREPEFDFKVVAPLPFPTEQYLRSTTFTQASEEEKEKLTTLPHESFYVELATEGELSEDDASAQRERCLQGDAGRATRYAHLRASGEYVASYCDLLLAVTDVEGAPSVQPEPAAFDPSHGYAAGSPAIMQVRRLGVTPGLLPNQPELTWADTGPVVLLPWKKGGKEPPNANLPDQGQMHFYWHPEEDPYETPSTRNAKRDAELETLRETADLIASFNRRTEPSQRAEPTDPEKHLRGMLDLEGDQPLPSMPAPLKERLVQIANLRNRARNSNDSLSKKVDQWRDGFVWAGVALAVLLQLQFHWVPTSEAAQESVRQCRSWIFIMELVAILGFPFALFRFRQEQLERDQIDCRCIAEGLRVQFFWTAIGVRVSAAALYLMRQRTPIRWIVGAVSSASTPYAVSRRAFQSMPPRAKYTLLKQAVQGWIQAPKKKGQISYFAETLEDLKTSKNKLRTWGRSCFYAGLICAITLGLAEGWITRGGTDTPLVEPASPAFLGALLLAISGLCGWTWAVRRWSPRQHPVLPDPDIDGTLVRLLACARKQRPAQAQAQARWVHRHLTALGLGLLLALTTLLLAASVTPLSDWMPSLSRTATIGKNLFFILSGACFLQSRLQFQTENERNYSGMLRLFESGNDRLQQLMQRLDAATSDTPAPEAEIDALVANIQDQCVALGREALAEHAEWLHLHRDRPVSAELPTP